MHSAPRRKSSKEKYRPDSIKSRDETPRVRTSLAESDESKRSSEASKQRTPLPEFSSADETSIRRTLDRSHPREDTLEIRSKFAQDKELESEEQSQTERIKTLRDRFFNDASAVNRARQNPFKQGDIRLEAKSFYQTKSSLADVVKELDQIVKDGTLDRVSTVFEMLNRLSTKNPEKYEKYKRSINELKAALIEESDELKAALIKESVNLLGSKVPDNLSTMDDGAIAEIWRDRDRAAMLMQRMSADAVPPQLASELQNITDQLLASERMIVLRKAREGTSESQRQAARGDIPGLHTYLDNVAQYIRKGQYDDALKKLGDSGFWKALQQNLNVRVNTKPKRHPFLEPNMLAVSEDGKSAEARVENLGNLIEMDKGGGVNWDPENVVALLTALEEFVHAYQHLTGLFLSPRTGLAVKDGAVESQLDAEDRFGMSWDEVDVYAWFQDQDLGRLMENRTTHHANGKYVDAYEERKAFQSWVESR
ncbi:hypothetical protein [Leptolyngbya sp. FACHB-711]|nr:hypothetical protein [Leptolyngbya sp. FACHB-711]MBD1849106.1 hypothetical protein [Cyanobacteria bacterium FACHB-502]MBD2028146.1 hypothetical protein [Leptolyngbya sp. FACHB-711]